MPCNCKCCCGCCCDGENGSQALQPACEAPKEFKGKGTICDVCCDLGEIREDIDSEEECPGTWVVDGRCKGCCGGPCDGENPCPDGCECVDGQCVTGGPACPSTVDFDLCPEEDRDIGGKGVCCYGSMCLVGQCPSDCEANGGTYMPDACDCCPTDPETGTGANVCGEEGWLFVTYDGDCRNGACENVGYMFCTLGTKQSCEDNIAWCLQNPDACDELIGQNAWCIPLGAGNPLP